MVANPKFNAALAHVDEAAIQPLPHSRKIYASGSRADLRVPMREIAQADTAVAFGAEKNPPIFVYDTSGPYTDPAVRIDIRQGLAPLRAKWILERSDTEELGGPTSAYGRERLADGKLAEMRFDLKRKPRGRESRARGDPDALRAPRHRHARDGIHRDPRERATQGVPPEPVRERTHRREDG